MSDQAAQLQGQGQRAESGGGAPAHPAATKPMARSECFARLRDLGQWLKSLPRSLGASDRLAVHLLRLQQLRLEYEQMPRPAEGTHDPHAGTREKIDELLKMQNQEIDPEKGWLALDELESRMLSMHGGLVLARRDWRLRQEYKRLATADLYEAYINSKPPDPDDAASQDTVRQEKVKVDAAYLVEEVQRLRFGRGRLEMVRTYFAGATLVLTVVCGFFLFRSYQNDVTSKAVNLVPLVGVFGSFFSLLSRLFSIPIKGDLFDGASSAARRFGWYLTPFISAAQGAIAAFVLYFLLMGGMDVFASSSTPVTTDNPTTLPSLFPRFRPAHDEANKGYDDKGHRRKNFPAEPVSPTDAAKLYVFCFLAGFSERLVPDILSQLADKAKARKSSEP